LQRNARRAWNPHISVLIVAECERPPAGIGELI
jgi:hypothetical protein